MTLKQRFIDVLVIRQLQQNSVQTYLSIFDTFERWLATNNLKAENATHDQLKRFIASSNSASVIRQRIGVLKNLYEFCLNQGYKTYGFPYPKKKKLIPEYLTPYELSKVFAQIKNKKQLAIVKLQYACALRVHEVVKVKRTDFVKKYDQHQQKFVYDLRVCGKGGRIDEIPVPDETIQEIISYWQSLKEKPFDNYLFAGQFKDNYSYRSVQMVMTRALGACGLSAKSPTHILRHSRASHLIQAGVDISYIQKLLRHSSVKTTMVYTHFKITDMRVIFNRADLFIQDKIENEKQHLLKEAC